MTTPNSNDPATPIIDRQADVTAEALRESGVSAQDRPIDPMTSPTGSADENHSSGARTLGESDDFGTNVGVMIEEEVGFVAEPERQREFQRRGHGCNVGRIEQKFRLGAGTALLVAAALAPVSRGWKFGFAVLGAAELITGSLRSCPVSRALGINTCRGDET